MLFSQKKKMVCQLISQNIFLFACAIFVKILVKNEELQTCVLPSYKHDSAYSGRNPKRYAHSHSMSCHSTRHARNSFGPLRQGY